MAELRPFKTYTGVQKRSALARKVGVAHALQDCINAKIQVSVQIKLMSFYCTIKVNKQDINKVLKI